MVDWTDRPSRARTGTLLAATPNSKYAWNYQGGGWKRPSRGWLWPRHVPPLVRTPLSLPPLPAQGAPRDDGTG